MEVIQSSGRPDKRLKFGRTTSFRPLPGRSWQSPEEYTSLEDSIYWQISSQVDVLADTYAIINKDALQTWAQTHPDALLALQAAPETIAAHFADADLRLEVKSDPEEPGPPKLYVRIITRMSVSDAVDAFMHVNEKMAPRLRRASDGDMVLTYDVIPLQD